MRHEADRGDLFTARRRSNRGHHVAIRVDGGVTRTKIAQPVASIRASSNWPGLKDRKSRCHRHGCRPSRNAGIARARRYASPDSVLDQDGGARERL